MDDWSSSELMHVRGLKPLVSRILIKEHFVEMTDQRLGRMQVYWTACVRSILEDMTDIHEVRIFARW